MNDKSGKIERIFGYMVYLTCRVAIENVLRDERRRKALGKPAVELMDKVNRIANERMVLEQFINLTLKNTLFPMFEIK